MSKTELSVRVPDKPGAYQLVRLGVIVYVGSTSSLRRRYRSWCREPSNPVVAAVGWDRFRYLTTRDVSHARHLEMAWYRVHRPVGNLIRPRISQTRSSISVEESGCGA